MYNPDDSGSLLANVASTVGAAASVLAVAFAVLTIGASVDAPPARAGLATAAASESEPKVLERQERSEVPQDGTYQLRCWQQGKLVFEENGVKVDMNSGPYGPKLRGTDKRGNAVVLADTRNATCLIRRERLDAPRLP